MKKKTVTIIISILIAMLFMSGGYGSWKKNLYITGNIKIVAPEVPQADLGGGEILEEKNKIETFTNEFVGSNEKSREIDTQESIDKSKNIIIDKTSMQEGTMKEVSDKKSAINIENTTELSETVNFTNSVDLSDTIQTTETTTSIDATETSDTTPSSTSTETSDDCSTGNSDNSSSSDDTESPDSTNDREE
ncbi:hypothetical protein CACET_c08930 [Clostridium aceticum]|uniref:Uncharacterized protein n=1 Tax=Clostridium aceticum TaxID=84022 RepID=A0A0D8IEH8_9CLOT|nr:hypothetical protein [Clostridium aceticum]AKL94401.1 hypothetical protein CACET_c08930 [Clostridium aceticum]KJF28372.1 hypothetical protein TZ02_03130 [Clostridium aceticum]